MLAVLIDSQLHHAHLFRIVTIIFSHADDAAIIEELRNKVMNQATEIDRLREEKKALAEKISKNYLGDLLRAVNLMEQGLREKTHKLDQIDSGLKQIQDALAKMEDEQ